MRNAIFISAGIGNALLLVPLIKHLKTKGSLTAISTSSFDAHLIFEGFNESLFDEVIKVDSSFDWMKTAATIKKRFNTVYLDHFASTRRNIILAHTNSLEVVTNTLPHALPKIFVKKIRLFKPRPDIHEASQYMRFAIPGFEDEMLTEELFRLSAKKNPVPTNRPYITLQPGSGNNSAPWKTLTTKKWVLIIHELITKYPDHDIVVLGDKNEKSLSSSIPMHPGIVNMIGNTRISELPSILGSAVLHIGNDSGLMHLAGCLGVPTVTVWGGSDPSMYGWGKINSDKHRMVYHKQPCAPCNRWIKPNTTRVELPSMCPDFICLEKISIEEVLKETESLLSL